MKSVNDVKKEYNHTKYKNGKGSRVATVKQSMKGKNSINIR